MKNIIKYIIPFFLFFTIISCNKEIKNKSSISDSIISKETAIIVAKRFNQKIFSTTNRNNSRLSSLTDSLAVFSNGKQIYNVVTLYDKVTPAAYVVNYTNNDGYLIVAADKNSRTILAYIEHGSFTDTLNVPEGLKEWTQDAVLEINYIRTNNLLATTAIQKEWTLYSGGTVTYLTQPPYNPAENCDYYYVNTFGPYLQSHWDQGCGFNQLFPNMSCGQCGHTYVGCVAIAMGQIMYYHRWPLNYDWSLMENDNGTYSASRMLIDVAASVNMHYA